VNQQVKQLFILAACAGMFCAARALAAPGTGTPTAATNAELRALLLKDVHGKSHQPLADAGQKATVFFFVMHDCPLANTCAPEINRIAADYSARGVRSFAVYVEEELSTRAARKHAKEYGFTCPALLDRGQTLVQFTGATVSPETVVLGPDNALLYRGRIDDRLIAFGKQRVTPTRRDLREALDEILSGKPVSTPVTKAVGCYLPTKEDAKKEKRSDGQRESGSRAATGSAGILAGGHSNENRHTPAEATALPADFRSQP
jgi:peroxiredoxin